LVGRPTLAEGFSDFLYEDLGLDSNGVIDEAVARRAIASDHPATDAELLAMLAGKTCYDSAGKGRKDPVEYLGNIIESQHGSVLEHASWNFIIAGTSRVFSHEHVRHRAGCAISQRSQRYVKESAAGQILLPIIEQNPEALRVWQEAVEKAQEAYDQLVEILTADLRDAVPDSTLRIKTVRSAARSVMPNGTETVIFWTANARALRHYIELRGSEHADIEIRRVAIALLKIMQVEAPAMFSDFHLVDLADGTQAAHTEHHKV
jgi:thymidylate synthase (FAD)